MSSSGFRIKTPEVADDGEENVGDKRKGLGRTVLTTNTRDNQTSVDDVQLETATSVKSKPKPTAVPAKQATLKSFFTFHSQPKAKQPEASSSTIRVESSDTPSAPEPSKPKLAQLHLVPVRHASSTTITTRPSLLTTCPKCNMSYIRGGIGGQDDSVHRAHCVRVTEGVKWDSRTMEAARSSVTMTGAKLASWRRKGAKTGCGTVVRRDVEFGEGIGKGKAVGNVVCVEGYEAASDKRVSSLGSHCAATLKRRVGHGNPRISRYSSLGSGTSSHDPRPLQDLPLHHLLTTSSTNNKARKTINDDETSRTRRRVHRSTANPNRDEGVAR